MTQPVTTPVTPESHAGTLNDRAATQIRALMAAQRRTTSELADALGISHNSARRRMTGEGTFTLNQLQAAADWLGVRISDIITPTPGLDYGHPQ